MRFKAFAASLRPRAPFEIFFPRGPVEVWIDRDDFQRDFPVQDRIVREAYFTHRAFAKCADNHIPAEPLLWAVNFFFSEYIHILF
jgi:hypothetical protein